MTKLFIKNTFLCLVLFALSACGDKVDTSSTDTGSSATDTSDPTVPTTFTLGKSFYEAGESSCADCHGSDGTGSSPIDPDNCVYCGSIDVLASYINDYMPKGNALACSLDGEDSCAYTTAAYILNDFSTETVEEEIIEAVETPLARLTNDEYVNSVRTLLNLSAGSENVEAAKSTLSAESNVDGLTNDSDTQTLTQLAITGYSTMALAASADFLSDVTSREELGLLLDCSTIVEDFNVDNQLMTCVKAYSEDLISKAYRRPSNDQDVADILTVTDNIKTLHTSYDMEGWDTDAFKTYVESILQFILLSPEFLLIVENIDEDADGDTDGVTESNESSTTQLTDYEIATRLALFLAGTVPDDTLLADAEEGLLSDPAVRLEHANRLMNSETGISQFATLLNNWLDIDEASTTDDDLVILTTFITDWFANETPFSDIYQGPVTVAHTDGTESSEPLGVLGLKAFIASHTTYPVPSFITRGVFVVERLLCEELPEDIPADALDGDDLTPVEVFETHAQEDCATCHRVFDNYGAAFQQFDGETTLFDPSNQDFGDSFDLYDIGDITTSVSDLGDLGYTMAHSEKAPACMAELWYRHSLRRSLDTEGKDDTAFQTLADEWRNSGDTSMKSLMRSIVASDSFITFYE